MRLAEKPAWKGGKKIDQYTSDGINAIRVNELLLLKRHGYGVRDVCESVWRWLDGIAQGYGKRSEVYQCSGFDSWLHACLIAESRLCSEDKRGQAWSQMPRDRLPRKYVAKGGEEDMLMGVRRKHRQHPTYLKIGAWRCTLMRSEGIEAHRLN